MSKAAIKNVAEREIKLIEKSAFTACDMFEKTRADFGARRTIVLMITAEIKADSRRAFKKRPYESLRARRLSLIWQCTHTPPKEMAAAKRGNK